MDKNNNIKNVVAQYLCNTCGACFAVCNRNAITYKETVGGYLFPEIDIDKCIDCGLCLKVCPGINFCNTLLNKIPSNQFIGNEIKSYIGRAKDNEIFENCQSGGVVSALLCYALDTNVVDAVVTVAMNYGNPPRATASLSRTVNEILSNTKSKYTPVPILKKLKELNENDKRIIIVGLPCHLHGLWNLYDLIPDFKKKIILTIGLFCDRNMTTTAIDYLVETADFKDANYKKIIFRDKQKVGYPGNVHIKTKDGKSKILSSKIRMQIKDYFTPARCRICFDKLNIFSDVSFGDPWGIADADKINGETVCVARTEKGLNFIKKATDYIDVRKINYENIYKGQKIEIKLKEWTYFVKNWSSFNLKLPNYCQKILININESLSKIQYYKIRKKLKWSLELDEFDTRESLLNCVKLKLFKKRIIKFLFIPYIIIRKVLKKVSRIM